MGDDYEALIQQLNNSARSLPTDQSMIVLKLAETISARWRIHPLIPERLQIAFLDNAMESAIEQFLPDAWRPLVFLIAETFLDNELPEALGIVVRELMPVILKFIADVAQNVISQLIPQRTT